MIQPLRRQYFAPTLLTTLVSVFSSAAIAEQGTWKYSGFLNQAIIHSSDNNFAGETDDALATSYSEAGIQITGNVLPKLSLSSQALSRHAGELDDGQPRIDQLQLTYLLQEDYEYTQGIRLGRAKQHYGLYNETRDVPFTRPGVLLPQSMYYDRMRNSLLIVDQLYYFLESHVASGFYSLSTGFYRSRPKDSELADFFSMDVDIKTSGDIGQGFQFTWRNPSETWMLGTTVGKTSFKVKTNNRNLFNSDGSFNFINSDGTMSSNAFNVFVQYTAKNWTFTGEATQVDSRVKHLNTFIDDIKIPSLSYYAQAEYRFNEKHELLLRYDILHLNKNDPNGEEFAKGDQAKITHLPAYSQYANDATIGYAYRPTASWMLRVELHNVEGTAWTSHLENHDSAQLAKHWDLVLAQLSYRF